MVIYLREHLTLGSEDLLSDFEKRWPDVAIKPEGRQQNTFFFGVANSHITVEPRHSRIPDSVTDEAIKRTRHWTDAYEQLKPHTAHVDIAAMAHPSNAVSVASDITKLTACLLALADALGVCWLNGPVLNSRQDFVDISKEVFGAGILPSFLWVAASWEPQCGLIYTTGMNQFGRPDFFLAHQTPPGNVEYLFDLVNYVLTSGNELLDGETVDGPDGVLRIQALERSDKTGKSGLMLIPVRPN